MNHTIIKVVNTNDGQEIELAGELGDIMASITKILIKVSSMTGQPLINALGDIYLNAMLQGAVKGEKFNSALASLLKQVMDEKRSEMEKQKHKEEA